MSYNPPSVDVASPDYVSSAFNATSGVGGLPSLPAIPAINLQQSGSDIEATVKNGLFGNSGWLSQLLGGGSNSATDPSTLNGNPLNGFGLFDTTSEFFLRGTVIITGFIFLGIGLSMFKPAAVVINKIKEVVS